MANELIIYRGDSEIFDITITDETGAPFFLKDYEITFTVKKFDTDLDNEAIIGPKKGVITDAEAGLARIELNPADTNVSIGSYVYDVQIYNASLNIIKTVVKSIIIVNNDVTKGV